MDDLLTRGVTNIIPGRDELKKLLESGKKLNVYIGIDPTSTQIHLGHALPLRKLGQFADLGHNVTFLIGDFTALVGDTSDKDSERPLLSKEQIEENFKTYKEQASKILDFNKVSVKFNSQWLNDLNYVEIFKLKQQFSLNDFISRELIKNRLAEGKNIRLDETEYPIMQGYDSYYMDTDVQIGGADQVFNMQAGRTLQKRLRNKESYVLCTEYLMGTDGRKMSKSWGNAIWLTDEPFEMYRKIMAINDDQIKNYFALGTDIPMNEIPNDEDIKNNPLEVKKKLAERIVTELHSEAEAGKAGEEFQRVVQKGELSSDLKVFSLAELNVSPNPTASEIALATGIISSNSEFKRIVDQKGVKINGQVISSYGTPFEASDNGTVLEIGRKSVKMKK